MSLKYKLALVIFSAGLFLLVPISLFIYYNDQSTVLNQAEAGAREVVGELSNSLSLQLLDLSKIARSMTLAPLLHSELRRSNNLFSSYDPEVRNRKIGQLNRHWMRTSDRNDPFVSSRLNNPLTDFLRKQQKEFPGVYGEIFVTNRYGLAIATTTKLTTLSHREKYWWTGSFFNGDGRVYFDDRGFDESVGGYVLGVVVPIYSNQKIIGILKANVNIVGGISKLITQYSDSDNGSLQLVRSSGKIIFKADTPPLTTKVSPAVIDAMQNWRMESMDIDGMRGEKILSVIAPVEMSRGTDSIGFGGSSKSIDHTQGNAGESWFLIINHNKADLLSSVTKINLRFVVFGLVFSLLMAIGALLLGHHISKPIIMLSKWVRTVGGGKFLPVPACHSHDEVEALTTAFNEMLEQLEQSTISRARLEAEVAHRKQAEKNARSALEETQQLAKSLKDTQAQVLHREKMASIGQLAAGVAHEINNPVSFVLSNLSSLGGYSSRIKQYCDHADELLAQQGGCEVVSTQLLDLRKRLKISQILEDMPELVAESKEGAERVSVIVQNLKNFSREETNGTTLACINECLQSTLKMVFNEIKYKATLTEDYGDLPQIECSPGELNQVFMNLLVNAGHAIEEQGEIDIKTWQQDASLFVRISDTGRGIAKEVLPRIFDPFFTTKEVGKGTGLGLSISYDIIQRHNGNLTVQSTPGSGTSFTIELPVAA